MHKKLNKKLNKRLIGIAAAAALLGVMAVPAAADPPSCNWGRLTADAILEEDFEQGPHSSDPSGDGHGPGTADEARAGLGNVVEQGNLEATCVLIDSIFP